MLNRCLSPVLSEALPSENKRDILFSEIADPSMLKEYFVHSMSLNLLRKERTIVIIPDQMDLSIPSKILARENLAHYSCSFQRNDDIHPMLAERARLLAELKEIPILRQEYNLIALKYRELQTKISDTLSLITRSTVKNPSFKDMLLSTEQEPSEPLPSSAIEEIAKINLNHNSITRIKKWQESFDKYFIYVSQSCRLSSTCFEDDGALQFARDEIASLSEQLTQNVHAIEEQLFTMKNEIRKEIDQEVSIWVRTSEELQNVFLEHEVENYPTSFEEKGMPVIRKLYGFKYIKFHTDVNTDIGWGQVPQLLVVINKLIEDARTSVDAQFEEYVRKLSPSTTSVETWIVI